MSTGAVIGGGAVTKKYDIITGNAQGWGYAHFKAVPIGTLAGDAYLCSVEIYYDGGAINYNYSFSLPSGFPKPDEDINFPGRGTGYGFIHKDGSAMFWSGGVTEQRVRTSYISMMK